ncbi:hypothetical protein [Oceanisphaera sp.]|uniref:hypothetical protein n=1 Tax=Oceanisphaera sp. TaxID=1929979 RepID=UPI003A90B2F2
MASRGFDWLSKILVAMTIGGWTLYLLSLILLHYGRPEQHFGYLRYQGIAVRAEWLSLYNFWFHAAIWGTLGLAVTVFTLVHVKGRHQLQFLKVYLAILAVAAVLTLLLIVFSTP